jgi:hypothetical protein
MEFTRETVLIPKVMKALAEKDIKVLNYGEVQDFKRSVRAAELENLKRAYLGKHQVVVKFVCSRYFPWNVLLVLFASVLVGTIGSVPLLVFVGATLSVLSLIFGPLWAWTKMSRLAAKEWWKSPFQNFKNRYKGSIAYDLCSCYRESGRGCIDPLITLEVEWHEASDVKFLVASNPDEPEEEPYYVDCWV